MDESDDIATDLSTRRKPFAGWLVIFLGLFMFLLAHFLITAPVFPKLPGYQPEITFIMKQRMFLNPWFIGALIILILALIDLIGKRTSLFIEIALVVLSFALLSMTVALRPLINIMIWVKLILVLGAALTAAGAICNLITGIRRRKSSAF